MRRLLCAGVAWAAWTMTEARLELLGQAPSARPLPVITAITPLAVAPGEKTTLRILGANLATARQILFPGTSLAPIPVKERKAAELPKGFEMKEAGETQLEIVLDLTQQTLTGSLPVAIQCESARSDTLTLPVRSGSTQTSEKEPNNAFGEANPISAGIPVLGSIQSEKDTDVYSFHPTVGEQYEAAITATGRASLLDGSLAVYDADLRLVISADDTRGADPLVRFLVSRPGPHFLVVTDAADKGGAWSPYELLLSKLP
jgi:hypothetical protein